MSRGHVQQFPRRFQGPVVSEEVECDWILALTFVRAKRLFGHTVEHPIVVNEDDPIGIQHLKEADATSTAHAVSVRIKHMERET